MSRGERSSPVPAGVPARHAGGVRHEGRPTKMANRKISAGNRRGRSVGDRKARSKWRRTAGYRHLQRQCEQHFRAAQRWEGKLSVRASLPDRRAAGIGRNRHGAQRQRVVCSVGRRDGLPYTGGVVSGRSSIRGGGREFQRRQDARHRLWGLGQRWRHKLVALRGESRPGRRRTGRSGQLEGRQVALEYGRRGEPDRMRGAIVKDG